MFTYKLTSKKPIVIELRTFPPVLLSFGLTFSGLQWKCLAFPNMKVKGIMAWWTANNNYGHIGKNLQLMTGMLQLTTNDIHVTTNDRQVTTYN